MKLSVNKSVPTRRTAEFVEKEKHNPFKDTLAKAARIAKYRLRAIQGRDIFTGQPIGNVVTE